MVEGFNSFPPLFGDILGTRAATASTALNLGAIHPLYISQEFEYMYMKHLAQNMINESWIDISLEQRMWISRFFAFSCIYKHEVFPECDKYQSFNETVQATCTRLQARCATELAPFLTARSVSQLIKPDLGELSEGFLDDTPTRKERQDEIPKEIPKKSPERTPKRSLQNTPKENSQNTPEKIPLRNLQKASHKVPQNSSLGSRQMLTPYESLHVDIAAAHAVIFIGYRGRNCKYWVNQLRGVQDIFVLGEPTTVGTRSVAIISQHAGGEKDRQRVHDLVRDFNQKMLRGEYKCEWLDVVTADWIQQVTAMKTNKRGVVRNRKNLERRELEMGGNEPADYFGEV